MTPNLKFPRLPRTGWPTLVLLGLSLLILLPRLLSPSFGLLDDGRTLTVAHQITQGQWRVDFDLDAGRFRPVYWAYYALLYRLADAHPLGWFVGNLVLLGLAGVLLARWAGRRSGQPVLGWLAAGLFVLSGPVIENVYTLSKSELLQVVLILGGLNLLEARSESLLRQRLWRWAGATLLFLLAAGVKETTLVIGPIGLGWVLLGLWHARRHPETRSPAPALGLAVTGWLAGGLFYALRRLVIPTALTAGTYTNAYALTASAILASLTRWAGWLLRDFLYLLPLAALLLYLWLRRKHLPGASLALEALVWMAGWMVIFLPWVYMVEYYMLPFSVGAAVLGAVGLVEAGRALRAREQRPLVALGLGLSLLLLLSTLPTHLTNARLQVAVDRANDEALRYVAAHLPPQATLLINLQDPNEYYEQIGLRLRTQYTRADLHLQPFQPDTAYATPYYVLSPSIQNQPRLSVRLGVYEPTQAHWNASLAQFLAAQAPTAHPIATFTQSLRLFNVNWPRGLCFALPRLNYCAQAEPFLDRRPFTYGWTLYAVTDAR